MGSVLMLASAQSQLVIYFMPESFHGLVERTSFAVANLEFV